MKGTIKEQENILYTYITPSNPALLKKGVDMPFKVGDKVRITGIPGYQQAGTITNIFTDPLDTIIAVETPTGKVSCFPAEIQKA